MTYAAPAHQISARSVTFALRLLYAMYRMRTCVVFCLLLLACGAPGAAHAASPALRTLNADQNLTSLGGTCMVQDQAGYLLVCTEHGVFVYDGRRFTNLGIEQGLREGGVVYDIVLTPDERIAIRYADEVLISDRGADNSHPPTLLHFTGVAHGGLDFFNQRPHSLVAWHDALVLLVGATPMRISVRGQVAPSIEDSGYDREDASLLRGGLELFSAIGHLWETFEDGRICQSDPGAIHCYGERDGLPKRRWVDVADDGHGHVFARSENEMARLDPETGAWSIQKLPDQGGRYSSYRDDLGIFRTPDGGLMTQADHGLAILGEHGWRAMTTDEGAPSGTIVSALTDASGQLWFQVRGRGLVRWVGYGHWQTVDRSDGLSEGIAWQIVRSPGGRLWVATDTGVDEIQTGQHELHVTSELPGGGFALTLDARGKLWRGVGATGVRVVDLSTRASTDIATPPVNVLVSDAKTDTVWVGTQSGLFRVPNASGSVLKPVPVGRSGAVVADLIDDGEGGVLYLASGRLRHLTSGGVDTVVPGPWPGSSFDPIAITRDHQGKLWIAGGGGLYAFRLAQGAIASYTAIPTSQTRTNSVVALMTDHRGWIWAGTALGLSVFDGKRWASIDADGGLASDDVDQGGLHEDPDGSIWIATSQGLSHLIDPEWLFKPRAVKAVISQAQLGNRPVSTGTLPYSVEPLFVQFGTPNDVAERSFTFSYELSGVDSDRAETISGSVRYPFVPPGHHTLTVVGYDHLTHTASPPALLEIDMAYPWWRRWWAEALWTLLGLAILAGFTRLRIGSVLRREIELKRRISEATEKLQHQAAHDSLTGLLNRSETERLLAERLSGEELAEEMIAAMVDIDHFKRINDTFGHLGGDDVLRAVGDMMRRCLEPGEFAGRYGGEEILLVLSDADGSGAQRVLDLHHALRGTPFSAAGAPLRLTCSIGVAWARRGDNWESLIGRADEALYKAKSEGRDRVVESGRIYTDSMTFTPERRVRPRSI